MKRQMQGLETVNLPPGEMYLAKRPVLLQTILGSCVSATFWSPRLGIGALCHGVLPICPYPWNARTAWEAEGYRYVDFSLQALSHIFNTFGLGRHEIEVKLFGGADVIPIFASRADRPTVGSLNAKRATEILEQEGLTICSQDLKGTRGRKVIFSTKTGDVFVRKLRNHQDIPF
jgi:chemotaxis protein CheD